MMKRQKWLLLAPATLALAAGCMLLSTNDTTTASAAGTPFYTAAQIGISGDASDYATLVSGATADDFTMEKGASVRTSVNGDGKLGIRFKTNVAKAGEGKYYTELTLGLETPITVYVECSPEEDGEYYASLLYSNLTETEKAAYKALEVTARGVYVDDTGYAYTKAEDNVRTMEGVANAAILAGTPEEDVAEYVTSFTTAEKVYGEQAAGLSVSYNGTASAVYMNAKKLASTDLSAISLAAEEVGSEGWVSVVDANGNFTNYPYLCATKVIRQASDLVSLYVTSGEATIEGYFALANDIIYAEDPFTPNPAMDTAEKGSWFCGTFDGQGHVLEYGLKKNGLFGGLGNNALIKDTSFIVKAIPETDDIASLTMLAKVFHSDAKKVELENVYATYDVEFTPNLQKTFWGQTVGVGLFESARVAIVNMKNVLVDMSKVHISNPFDETKNFTAAYGPFASRNLQNVGRWTYTNTYAIFDNPLAGLKRSTPSSKDYYAEDVIDGACYAENKVPEGVEVLTAPYDKNSGNFKLVGVNQFANYAEAKTYFANNKAALTAFENFTDISLGFPVANAESCVNYNTTVMVDDGAATETAFDVATSASKTLSLNFLGADVENVTVAHDSGVEVVAIEGTTITYTAGVAGQEFLTVSATIGGVLVEKSLTVNVIVPDMSNIYFDTDATLPAALKDVTITKVTDAANAEEEYFDGTTWNVAANTSNAIVEHDALVYGESGLLGSAKIVVATKVIETTADLACLYGGSSSAPITGYFLLANDITDNAAFKPTPGSSHFAGVLNGNGKKIEFTLNKNGLFGNLASNATIENVGLIVKGVTAATSNTDSARLAILAHEVVSGATNITINGVYAKYDIENFQPQLYVNNWGQAAAMGFVENMIGTVKVQNSIIDMSKVPVIDHATEDGTAEKPYTFGYGVFGTRNQNLIRSGYWTAENVYVIWANPYVALKRSYSQNTVNSTIANICFAENDKATYDSYAGEGTKTLYTGVNRYADYAAAVAAGVTKVGSFVISSEGVSQA